MGKGTTSGPCRVVPNDPTLHVWRPAASVGWFTCASCGAVGVCQGCLTKRGGTAPTGLIPVWCATHHAVICSRVLPLNGAASVAV